MRERARKLVVSGLDRALAARGFEGTEATRARATLVDWARVRAASGRRRRAIVGGVRIVVTRPGRAELIPFEALAAGPGELTVEMLASAVSPGTERAQWLRLPNAQPSFPHEPGYSGAGRVLAIGAGVTGFAEGDLVAVPRARHASVASVPAEWASRVPDGVPVEQAALVYLAIISAYGVRRAGPLAGRSVCVLGAGPIGVLAQRLAALEGPRRMTVVARTDRHRDMAAVADEFLTADQALDGVDADVVVEATGDPAAIGGALEAAATGGTVVLLGSPRGVSSDAGLDRVQAKGLRLVGAHISSLATEAKRAGADPFAKISHAFLGSLADGRLDVSDLAGEAVDPREITHFYGRLARGEAREAHLDWTAMPRDQRVRRPRRLALPRLSSDPPPLSVPAQPSARSPEAPLRFAVIGCGDIGYANARAIAAAAGAELALAHDADEALARAVADRFGGDVARPLEDALDRARADAVFLSVPHDLHAPLAARAAEAGLHVVLEKPLAEDLASGREAVKAAARSGVQLSVCFAFRYHRAIQTARALFRAGALGKLRGMNLVVHTDKPDAYWLGGFSGRSTSDWRASRERAGGGVLIMNVTHYIDLARYVTGADPVEVSGTQWSDEAAEVEDQIALSVTWSGGAIGTVSASSSTRGSPANRFEIWGERGTLRIEPDPAAYTELAVDSLSPGIWTPLSTEDEGDIRTEFVERFAAAVAAGQAPDVSPGDALAVQAFVEAAYAAVADRAPAAVEVPG